MAVATAGFFVMRQVARDAPRVSVDEIDSELAVDVIPVIGKRGKPLSQKYARNKNYVGRTGPSYKPPIPFTWLLIGARANPASRYNQLTNNRYAIAGGHPFKGRHVSEFASIMTGFITRMTKSRHSSIAFIASVAVPVIKRLEQWVSPKYRRGAPPRDAQAYAAMKHSKQDKGEVELLGAGSTNASVKVDLLIGLGNSVLSEKQNEAMHQQLGPVVQSAVNAEAAKAMEYVAREEMKSRRGAFASAGVLVH